MKRVLCIGCVAALSFACGRSEKTSTNEPAQTPAPATSAANGAPGATGTSATGESVVLIGCLQRGSDINGTVGTSGTAAPATKDRPDSNPSATPPAADRFMLTNARSDMADTTQSSSPAAASAGTNSPAPATAGTSGTANASYMLEGSGDLTPHENQQVRVSGRLVNDALSGGVLSSGSVNEKPRRIAVDSVTMIADKCAAK